MKIIALTYHEHNRAPSIIIDNEESVQFLGPYWFQTKIRNVHLPEDEMPTLYWRQKACDSCDEFEVRFEPPVTGVSSGRATVGAHIIIDTEDDGSFSKYRVSENGISGEMDL